MHAIIKTGGKQYRVSNGKKLKIERISANIGEKISFKEVLSVGNDCDIKIGSPIVKDSCVEATVLHHGRFKKIKIFKMRRRKHNQLHMGHRQNYTEIRIDYIL
ncbi:MAG: 50S ribosomal protein L21 [Bordetella sp.]|nr:MAG: 50S ribosomal protein L21 [Bordetella sp.]